MAFPAVYGKFISAVSGAQAEYIYSASNAPANFFIGAPGTAGGGLHNFDGELLNTAGVGCTASSMRVLTMRKWGHRPEPGGVARWFARAATITCGNDKLLAPPMTLPRPAAVSLPMFAFRLQNIWMQVFTSQPDPAYGRCTVPRPRGYHGLIRDGTLEPIRVTSKRLISLEAHPLKKLDIFGYAGAEYAQRTTYRNAAGTLVGYAPVTANNSGCNTESIPSGSGNGLAGCGTLAIRAHLQTASARNSRCGSGNGRVHLSYLQQSPVRPFAVSGAVQLLDPQWMDRRWRRSQGHQQYGLHRNALLHSVRMDLNYLRRR